MININSLRKHATVLVWLISGCYIYQVEVKAVPIDTDPAGDDLKRIRRQSRPDEGNLTYGGHPPPCLDTQYEVTITDKKEAFHAICLMKVKIDEMLAVICT